MHRDFRKLLEKASGSSEFVIAVNVDVRNFSAFSKKVDSIAVSMYIKRLYIKLIDDYFSNASFYKPTGDGLLIVIPYSEDDLKEVANNTVSTCIKLVQDFHSLCDKDEMINFEVPTNVGIGISRGTASYMVSGKKCLDYSGTVLNLATRLMDIARPKGIVIDSNFGIKLLEDKTREIFKKDKVYIKGISEEKPLEIHFTRPYTKIPSIYKNPVKELNWRTIEDKVKFKKIKDTTGFFRYALKSKPIIKEKVSVKVTHGLVRDGKRVRDQARYYSFDQFEYYEQAGKPYVNINFPKLTNLLEINGVKSQMDVFIEIMYPER